MFFEIIYKIIIIEILFILKAPYSQFIFVCLSALVCSIVLVYVNGWADRNFADKIEAVLGVTVKDF